MVLAATRQKELGWEVRGVCTGKLELGCILSREPGRGALKSRRKFWSVEQMFSSGAQSSPFPLTKVRALRALCGPGEAQA